MTYEILSADQIHLFPRARQPIDWPMQQLEVGHCFLIPMRDGLDKHGRREDIIRALVAKFTKRLDRRFSCRKCEAGLMVVRTA
jgi:hypothetical protein